MRPLNEVCTVCTGWWWGKQSYMELNLGSESSHPAHSGCRLTDTGGKQADLVFGFWVHTGGEVESSCRMGVGLSLVGVKGAMTQARWSNSPTSQSRLGPCPGTPLAEAMRGT